MESRVEGKGNNGKESVEVGIVRDRRGVGREEGD